LAAAAARPLIARRLFPLRAQRVEVPRWLHFFQFFRFFRIFQIFHYFQFFQFFRFFQ
jgi:hypothetical protein